MESLVIDLWLHIVEFISFGDLNSFLLINRETLSLKNSDAFYRLGFKKLLKELECREIPMNIKFRRVESWKESKKEWSVLYKKYKNEASFKSIVFSQRYQTRLKNPTASSFSKLIYLNENSSQNLCANSICVICKNYLYRACVDCRVKSGDQICSIVIGKCSHVYHTHCMERWLVRRDSCLFDDGVWAPLQFVGLS